MKTYIRKDKKFFDIYSAVVSLLSIIISIVLFGIMGNLLISEKIEDTAKISKITSMREIYQDDYTKALELDNVTIVKDEDIIITIETSSYKLVSTYNINGDFIKDKLEAKITNSESISLIILAVCYSFLIYWILCIPGLIIKYVIGKKDDVLEETFNKEQKRLEKIRLKEKYPNLYRDLKIDEDED